MPTSDDLRATIARVRALLDKATPQNIDTAEVKEDGYFMCPHCEGDGYVDGKLYVNYDGVASNVQFSGIGREHKDAEELFRALIATAPALLDAAERAQDARNAALEADNHKLRLELLALLGQKIDTPSTGCHVCGLGKDGQPMGYACPRSDCPMNAR